MPSIIVRRYPAQAFDALVRHGLHPVLARVYAARGIDAPHQLDAKLSQLIPFERLKNVNVMAAKLADAIRADRRLLIVADYDSDGATACAVGMRALRAFGATVGYLVPNRFEYGYGLTPEIVRLAAAMPLPPDIILTVDNGIASVEGVEEAGRLGMQVFVTDHHLPGDRLPPAAAIVNPNQPGCGFPSKHLAGVGVMFYLMLALRAELRARGRFTALPREPNLAALLDLVTLGTVADMVKLDDNNRILVHQGLQRIRRKLGCAGIHALLQVARRDFRRTSAYDLGFAVAPRLNAAGRLDDMSLGIECLITDDVSRAAQLASQLDALNRQRREIEADMRDHALSMLTALPVAEPMPERAAGVANAPAAYSLSLFDPGWHQGVIGILASRMKERFHRPVVVFAPGNEGEIKGSGRSIAGFHLRDALDRVSKRHPGLLLKFGGHAAAAGLTLRADDFEAFRHAFEETAQALLTPADLAQCIETDGTLEASELDPELARRLTEQVWGQGFAQPTFWSRFRVATQRVVGEKHLKLKLERLETRIGAQSPGMPERLHEAVLFSCTAPLPEIIDAVYRMEINEFNGNAGLQLILDHWCAPGDG
ncbi:single-stranded-DNA-specific exonuclease RecJ [Nitrosovibrio sp. Nv17]|jgi:single-stranded-DNA-specific exonuclease|uniref:single-stranded-DNA-specific exonuclease RecJ n=1 Tax=Nitrosovibrio sp. Nv17 TaxID=1855339 RepID=UPI000908B8F3|nr:single-stranded-DNA-specific exonuclease RecJ [Nitrosovibrio sp. Nv17]SFW17951.1 single-stranded-DNA-specific exonuclease [Nitrosovibrio sp. Nv17]